MCDACDRLIDRRALLRGAIVGGTAIAGGALVLPRGAFAATGSEQAEGLVFEHLAMGEDARRAASIRAQTQVQTASQTQVQTSGQTQVQTSGQTQVQTSGQTTAASNSASTQTSGLARGLRVAPALNPNPLQAPPIVTRAQWGANESIRLDNRSYAPVSKLIVHHSASDNNPKSPASVVRLIQTYHTTGRGFSDTGYNYLIDHKGVIYEGRAARTYAAGSVITDEDNRGWGVVGAHAKSNNAGSCGICLIGNFDLGSPTDAAVASLVWLLAYKASRHRIDAQASDEYIDIYGQHRTFPNVSGHRQVGQTACPGSRLYKLLPTIRDEVVRRTGHYDPVTLDVAYLQRWEVGALRKPDPNGESAGTTTGSTSGSASGGGTTSGSGASSGPGDPGTGTKIVGFRVVSAGGVIYTAGSGRTHGNPSTNGGTKVVSLTNAARGDGYWALGADGTVYGFGGVQMLGDAAGKGIAADIVATPSGAGYWILMADGGIYPFGDALYWSSPKKAGVGGTSLRMTAKPGGDGYWVLMAGNVVRPFGKAAALGAPTASGNAVDVLSTATGKGYWVLTDTGVVAPFGDATDRGDLKRSKVKWSKHATHLLGTPSGAGYLIVNSEGATMSFGDAPAFASFGGSGIRATGAAAAYG